jgi:hypothetical protein
VAIYEVSFATCAPAVFGERWNDNDVWSDPRKSVWRDLGNLRRNASQKYCQNSTWTNYIWTNHLLQWTFCMFNTSKRNLSLSYLLHLKIWIIDICYIFVRKTEGKLEGVRSVKQEVEEEEVSSCWMTFKKREDTENWKRKHWITLSGDISYVVSKALILNLFSYVYLFISKAKFSAPTA